MSSPTVFGVPIRYLALFTLTLQNSASILIMRRSRTILPLYRASTAVLLVELIKIVICVGIYIFQNNNGRKSLSSVMVTFTRLREEVVSPDAWKLAIPAAIYAIMNNLIYLSATLLDAATFQVLYQMKILTTAAFAVLILSQPLTRKQWSALVVLTVGIALVQISGTSEGGGKGAGELGNGMAPTRGEEIAMSAATRATGTGTPVVTYDAFLKRVFGFFVVLTASLLSGAAGVYFEKILKTPTTSATTAQRPRAPPSLWLRNIQLGLFSLPPAILILLAEMDTILEYGFFYGYSIWAVASIMMTACGGLLVALVVRYADNILKGFATSISIVLSCIMSWLFFDWHPNAVFLFGAAAVMLAVFIYGNEEAKKKTMPAGGASAAGSVGGAGSKVRGEYSEVVQVEEEDAMAAASIEEGAAGGGALRMASLTGGGHVRQGSWAGGSGSGLAQAGRASNGVGGAGEYHPQHHRSQSFGSRAQGSTAVSNNDGAIGSGDPSRYPGRLGPGLSNKKGKLND